MAAERAITLYSTFESLIHKLVKPIIILVIKGLSAFNSCVVKHIRTQTNTINLNKLNVFL